MAKKRGGGAFETINEHRRGRELRLGKPGDGAPLSAFPFADAGLVFAPYATSRRSRERSNPPDFLRSKFCPACDRLGPRRVGGYAGDLQRHHRGRRACLDERPSVTGGWITAEYSMLPYSTLTGNRATAPKGKSTDAPRKFNG